MQKKPDIITNTLVKKKKELLDELLIQSICSVLNDKDNNDKRQQILSMLQTNDLAIKKREQSTGRDAKDQEKKLFSEITQVLGSIRDNNELVISRLKKDEKELEFEKLKLKDGGKLSYYVQQTKKAQPVKSLTPVKQARHHSLNGVA